MKLFVYRFYHPAHKNRVTLDCSATSKALARKSAIRFLRRENNRLRKATFGRWKCRLPTHDNEMIEAERAA